MPNQDVPLEVVIAVNEIKQAFIDSFKAAGVDLHPVEVYESPDLTSLDIPWNKENLASMESPFSFDLHDIPCIVVAGRVDQHQRWEVIFVTQRRGFRFNPNNLDEVIYIEYGKNLREECMNELMAFLPYVGKERFQTWFADCLALKETHSND